MAAQYREKKKKTKKVVRGEQPWYGSIPCQHVWNDQPGKTCFNFAYWYVRQPSSFLCGVHSRKYKNTRKALPKDPDAKAKRAAAYRVHREGCDAEAARRLKEAQARGSPLAPPNAITLEKLRMMRNPALRPGVLNVFPNFRHGNRKDGMGCATLSPKALGPVEHGQAEPHLPQVALNLENLHQGNKVLAHEVDPQTDEPTEAFFELQRKMYLDPVPHRHKPGVPTKGNKRRNTSANGSSQNRNIPAFSVWTGRRVGEPRPRRHKLTYVESRQIYCTFYEQLASQQAEFAALRRLLSQGYRLNIVGYDAYPAEPAKHESLAQCLERLYLDDSRPFGHELVLYALLVLSPDDYPWRKHRQFVHLAAR